MPRLTLFLSLLANIALTQTALSDPAQICDAAARQIADESNVPFSVLQAVTRTETGRSKDGTMRPWPWTVNMQGKGVWFGTEDEARAYVFTHFKKGARSFDVGCFQINYRWHGQNFNSIEEMFDPLINTRYAARFLTDLHRELGDWTAAVGAYHSRTRKFAERYVARYSRIHADLLHDTGPLIPPKTRGVNSPTRHNGYTLMTGGGRTPVRGSLVPLKSGNGSMFGLRAGG